MGAYRVGELMTYGLVIAWSSATCVSELLPNMVFSNTSSFISCLISGELMFLFAWVNGGGCSLTFDGGCEGDDIGNRR
jgi:hypothetical protein